MAFLPLRASLRGVRLVAGALLASVLSACGQPTNDEGLVPPGMQLPELGTLGRTPVGPAVIRVDVDEDGRISMGGQGPLSLTAFSSALKATAKEKGWTYGDGTSRKLLLINADARVPWVVPVTILMEASAPPVHLWHFFLAARGNSDGRLGALGITLPQITRQLGVVRLSNPPILVSVLAIEKEGPSEAPDSVVAPICEALAAHPKHWVTVRIASPPPKGGGVPTGFVAAVMDAALRAGARRLDFDGPAWLRRPGAGDDEPPHFERDDVESWLRYVAWFKARPGEPTVKVRTSREPDDEETVDDGQARPRAPAKPQGVLDRLYGSSVPVSEPQARDYDGNSEFQEPARVTGLEDPDAEPMPDEWILAEFGDDLPRRAASEPDKDPAPMLAVLAWLSAHRRPDHGWSADGAEDGDVGVTAQVLLAYLGAGYTSRGTHAWALPISQGFQFLKSNQDPEGYFGSRDRRDFARDHALAQLAMVEIYRRTRSPIYLGAVKRALAFTHASHGTAWGVRGDPATSAWMALGLWSASQSAANDRKRGRTARLEVDEELLEATVRSLSGAPGTALRAIAGGDASVREPLPPLPDLLHDPGATFWFTLAAFRRDDPSWPALAERVVETLTAAQHSDLTLPDLRGSWDPVGRHGRAATTALFALSLQMPWKYAFVVGGR
ncbi:MAG: hypothetical protein AB7T63_00395 [Planctomycetota bacterium]